MSAHANPNLNTEDIVLSEPEFIFFDVGQDKGTTIGIVLHGSHTTQYLFFAFDLVIKFVKTITPKVLIFNIYKAVLSIFSSTPYHQEIIVGIGTLIP